MQEVLAVGWGSLLLYAKAPRKPLLCLLGSREKPPFPPPALDAGDVHLSHVSPGHEKYVESDLEEKDSQQHKLRGRARLRRGARVSNGRKSLAAARCGDRLRVGMPRRVPAHCRGPSPRATELLPAAPPSLLLADGAVYKGTCPCGLGTRSWRGTRPSRSSPGRGNLLESCPAYLQCTCALNAPSRSGSSTSVSLFFCFFLQPQVQSVLDTQQASPR